MVVFVSKLFVVDKTALPQHQPRLVGRQGHDMETVGGVMAVGSGVTWRSLMK